MTPRTRALAAALGLALALPAGGAAGAARPGAPPPARAGASGIGDPYFPQDGNGGIDVLHYDVRVGYGFDTGRLTGATALEVRATQALSRFDLDFLLDVDSVHVDGRRARFRQVGDHELRITPARDLATGQRFRVVVRYAGIPADEAYDGERNWLADGAEVVTMNQPHMAAWWFPANDHPRDKASFDVHVTVPRRKQVVGNGVLVGRQHHAGRTTWHWRAVEPMAPYLAFFAAGSFETRSTDCHGLTTYTAVSRRSPGPAHRASARDLGRLSCDVVTALAGVLGPYPFSALGGVVTSLPVGFALENQTRPTYPAVPGGTPALVAHELAHQWFGDSVSVDTWRDIWLNEGLAQFLETWYTTEVTAVGSTQTWLTDTYARLEHDADFWRLPIDDPGPDLIFSDPVYTRGAMAVQALRHRVGEAPFWTLLQTWVAARHDGNGTIADFRAVAASVTGQDLTGFFDAWLHRRSAPARTAANGLG